MAYYRSDSAHQYYPYTSSRSERSHNYYNSGVSGSDYNIDTPQSYLGYEGSAPQHRREGHREGQRLRKRWPPPPSVEDETESLSKEFPVLSVDDGDSDTRGTIDQDPLMIELINPERRFVIVPNPGSENSSSVSSTSKSRRHGKKSRRGDGEKEKKKKKTYPDLKLDMEEPNLLERRNPTPYSYTPSGQKSNGEHVFSPEPLTPSAAKIPRSTPTEIGGARSPRREFTNESLTSSASKSSNSRTDYSDESDIDAREAAYRRRSRPSSARSSFLSQDSPHRFNLADELGTSEYLSSHYPIRSKVSKKQHSDPIPEDRSATPTLANSSKSRSATSPTPVPQRSGRTDSMYSSSPKKDFLRHSSIPIPGSFPAKPPPGSPRLDDSSTPNSPRGTGGSPRPSSRPGSPQTQFDPFFGQSERNVLQRTGSKEANPKYPSKLSSSIRQESVEKLRSTPRIDIYSASSARQSTAPLPYPDDNQSFAMPSEETFRTDYLNLSVNQSQYPRSPSVASNRSFSGSARTPTGTRGETSSRHLSVVEPPSMSRTSSTSSRDESRSRKYGRSRSTSNSSSSQFPCPRQNWSREPDDWRILENFPDFVVCSACYKQIIEPSPYRVYFKTALPRSSTGLTRCDFGSPWARAAWLQAHNQQRQDVDYINALARNSASLEDCPGADTKKDIWYGLQDQTGAFVPGFAICPLDKANVEVLFPSLVGIFTRLSMTKLERSCSFHVGSKRFAKYIDVLDAINDRVLGSSIRSRIPSAALVGPSDVQPFVDIAKRFSYSRPCEKDRMLQGVSWHFIPDFPEFTICPECYQSNIRPHVKAGSTLAELFTPIPQLLPHHSSLQGQASCQLYSPRMQRVFDTSVRERDVTYLMLKAKDRKSKEISLRMQRADWKRLMGGVGSSSHKYNGSGISAEKLKRELERVEREWEACE